MTWIIDPFHTLVEFSVVHLKINLVKGRFNEVRGSMHLDFQRPELSWVKAQINAASIYTGVAARDNHLRSADFFEVATYPTITFESTEVQQTGTNSGLVAGELTLHGVTRIVSFQTQFGGSTKDPDTGNRRIGFSAVSAIDRRIFNMHFSHILEGNIAFVANEARIELNIEAVQMD